MAEKPKLVEVEKPEEAEKPKIGMKERLANAKNFLARNRREIVNGTVYATVLVASGLYGYYWTKTCITIGEQRAMSKLFQDGLINLVDGELVPGVLKK